jgi:cell division protein FtsQ
LFEIREVQWEGRVRLRSDRLEASLGPVIGQNIFQIDLKKRVERISAQPGVKEASIRRALPDRIIVKVRERRPAVLLVRRSGAVLVDEEGVVLEPASLSSDLSPDLPRLLGEGAQDPEAIQQGLSLAEFLEREGLSGPRVIEVGRGGDLVLEWEGVRIHWGWGDYPEKWRYFQRAAEDLKRRKESYREADLRFDRQVVIR